MKVEQVAAQLFTLRDYCKDSASFAESMKKVRAMGYQAVQVSGVGVSDPVEIAAILNGEGLTCCATHENNIIQEPEAVAERLQKLACRYTAVPSPCGREMNSLADVKEFAADMNKAGEILHNAGITLTYHNHNGEFRRYDGQMMLEVIYGETDPRYLQGELDTYWVQYGGGDSAEWCERLKERLPLLHLKDYKTNQDGDPAFAVIGYGNLNWQRIMKAAEASGCEWFIVEQDRCDGSPFDSLQMSYEYIRDNLCE